MDEKDEGRSDDPAPMAVEDEARVIPAESLFAGDREVVIDLNGERYRLRITRRGKLILQK